MPSPAMHGRRGKRHDGGDAVNAATIAAALGNHRQEGAYWRCRCPIHGGTSLTLGNGPKGTLFIRCWYGCRRNAVVVALLQRGLITRGMAKASPEAPEQKAQREAAEARARAYRIACASDLWRQRHPAPGSIVEVYLWSRLLTMPVPPAIGLIGQQWHRESGGRWPAMICRVDHIEHGLVAVHLTYLNPLDPASRVSLDPRKRCIGPIKGAAVQLAPAAPRMAISEGVENGLAVMIGWEMPCWAALSANGVADLVLPPVETGLGCDIVIAADADAPGLIGARRAGRRWQAEGRTVRIATPGRGVDFDFNDLLIASS
jgi:putative DNA primase/helicase